jgi:subtilisin family serine protease
MSSTNLEIWYKSLLPPSVTATRSDTPFIHTYREAILGFAANLTEREAEYVSKRDGVLKVYEDYLIPLSTTHTPEFLGLRSNRGAWSSIGMGDGVIIGVLDTGIDVSHISFDDQGMKPPPAKWRGSCNFGGFRCNKKLIGGKSLLGGQSPRDTVGHGTHTASTAAGRFVEGASVLGSGKGTAAGMAPHAHLAIYQVCNRFGCYASNIIAGINSAITDGVDILSISLGGRSVPFHRDSIAISTFSAMRKGIFVSCAAGNSGPFPRSVENEAPWVLTVAASTMDRKMEAIVKLGDGRSFVGESAYQPSNLGPLPLVHEFGSQGLRGKVVACDIGSRGQLQLGQTVRDAGGAGVILLGKDEGGQNTFAAAHMLPASYVNAMDAAVIRQYLKSSNKPTASIVFNGTSVGNTPSPVVAYFSSRGPSIQTPGILKPDIIGPGVNVIAAWPVSVGPRANGGKFNTLSGTSMSTPHLSGIAAIIKSAHPGWSPAAIKSAIMTTAYVLDGSKKPILDEKLNPAGHFSIGAGHVNPSQAINPGLIYDTEEQQYISYLCGLGYTDSQVEIITRRNGACRGGKIAEAELNYPSISVAARTGKLVVKRTVTNVGDASSSYTVDIKMPKEVRASVSPSKLVFTKTNEKKTFTVSLTWDANRIRHAEGSLRWVSAKHVVRSPIVIF